MTSRIQFAGVGLPTGSRCSKRSRFLFAVTGAVVATLVLAFADHGAATVIGGGGSSRNDCLASLDAPVNDPPLPHKPKNIAATTAIRRATPTAR